MNTTTIRKTWTAMRKMESHLHPVEMEVHEPAGEQTRTRTGRTKPPLTYWEITRCGTRRVRQTRTGSDERSRHSLSVEIKGAGHGGVSKLGPGRDERSRHSHTVADQGAGTRRGEQNRTRTCEGAPQNLWRAKVRDTAVGANSDQTWKKEAALTFCGDQRCGTRAG